RTAGPAPPRLLVDLLSDEADLTVMVDRKVVFLRTTRLSGDPLQNADHRRALMAEIRRTIAAGENQLGGQRIESIALCGSGEQHAALAKSIEREVGTATTLFDPFALPELSRELRRELPEKPGRFASLLGMAVAELEQAGHAIDFLNPRRRPAPPSKQKKLVLAGAVAVVLVAGFFGWRGWERRSLKAEVGRLTGERDNRQDEVDAAKKAVKAVDAIETWTDTDVVWLDELNKLSKDCPPAKEVLLTDLKVGPGSRGGRITLEGLVAGAAAIPKTEDALRDQSRRRKESRRVAYAGSSPDNSNQFYSRRVTWFVFVEPEKQ
ncbi:MAG: type IV pilus biogenesis protein PilM, partial [Planctomycetota bacterium]